MEIKYRKRKNGKPDERASDEKKEDFERPLEF